MTIVGGDVGSRAWREGDLATRFSKWEECLMMTTMPPMGPEEPLTLKDWLSSSSSYNLQALLSLLLRPPSDLILDPGAGSEIGESLRNSPQLWSVITLENY